ncbi:hypothetical protein VTN02DRAFT_5363 [Thermoascus thermophilus]
MSRSPAAVPGQLICTRLRTQTILATNLQGEHHKKGDSSGSTESEEVGFRDEIPCSRLYCDESNSRITSDRILMFNDSPQSRFPDAGCRSPNIPPGRLW